MSRIIEAGKKKNRRPSREHLDATDTRRRPELDAGCVRILHAYDDVSTSRPTGFGMARIPHEVVIGWGQYHGFSYPLINHLWRVIRLVDDAVIRRSAVQQ